MLDCLLTWVGGTIRLDLGRWLSRRIGVVRQREQVASQQLRTNGHSEQLIREQWAQQRAAQTSIRKKTSAVVARELQAIASMQDKIYAVRHSIGRLEASIWLGRNKTNRELRYKLRQLRENEHRLSEQAVELYNELSIPQDLPGMNRYGRAFIKNLILLHDARRSVQQRVAGRLFEYERIDQAAGGTGRRLGTREHQRLINAMSKRTPALQNTIRRHNDILEWLQERLNESGDVYPLPEPLPTEVTKLKTTHANALLEDVITIDPDRGTQPWMTDASMRASIRALHVMDRCREERQRIGWEEANLFDWVRRRAGAIRAALADDTGLHSFLRQELARLGDLVSGCRDGIIPRHEWLEVIDDLRPPVGDPAHAEHRFGAAIFSPDRTPRPCPQTLSTPDPTPPPVVRFHRCDHEFGGADAPEEDEDGYHLPEGDNDDPDENDEHLFDVLDEIDLDEDEGAHVPPLCVTRLLHLSEDHVLLIDTDLRDIALAQAAQAELSHPLPETLTRDATPGFQALVVSQRQLRMLVNDDMLTDDVVYSSVSVFMAALGDNQTHATINPQAYGRWLESSANLRKVFEEALASGFWRRRYIIMPLFHESHWMAVHISLDDAQIDIYDSFASEGQVEMHGGLVASFLVDIFAQARENGHDDVGEVPTEWTVRPMVTRRQQFNGVDCGLWTIAALFAVIRGWQIPALRESDMPMFRRYLCLLLLDGLSVSTPDYTYSDVEIID